MYELYHIQDSLIGQKYKKTSKIINWQGDMWKQYYQKMN